MPKPVLPDRPIWPPLPAETGRRPERVADAPRPAPAHAGTSEAAVGHGGPEVLPDRARAGASPLPA